MPQFAGTLQARGGRDEERQRRAWQLARPCPTSPANATANVVRGARPRGRATLPSAVAAAAFGAGAVGV